MKAAISKAKAVYSPICAASWSLLDSCSPELPQVSCTHRTNGTSYGKGDGADLTFGCLQCLLYFTGGFTLALRELTAPGRKADISAYQQLSVGGPSISWEARTRRTQFRQLAPPWWCWIQGRSIFLLRHPVTSVKWPRAIASNVWPEDTQNTWRKNVTVIKIEMLFVFFTMLVFAPNHGWSCSTSQELRQW